MAIRAVTAALALLAVFSGGCGFHLRTLDVGTNLRSAYVVSNARNPFEDALRQALDQADVIEAPSAEAAEVVVELLDARNERRSVSVSGQGRAAEYQTTLAVQYRVLDGAGRELVPTQWLERERVFRVDRENIVGSSEEEALLEREMLSDLVQQMLRAIDAAVAGAAGAG